MENFECKAPMYVNFVKSSALDEDDDADKFFGNYNKATHKLSYEVVHLFSSRSICMILLRLVTV
jgi:hypothetical protein